MKNRVPIKRLPTTVYAGLTNVSAAKTQKTHNSININNILALSFATGENGGISIPPPKNRGLKLELTGLLFRPGTTNYFRLLFGSFRSLRLCGAYVSPSGVV